MSNHWLTPRALNWQLIALWAAVLPNMLIMPSWLILLLIACSGVRIQIYRGIWRFPHWSIKLGLLALLTLGLLYSFDRDTLMRGTVALLMGGAAFKLLEIHTRRDALVLIYLSYFIIAIHFLFAQGILSGIYALIAFATVVAAQVALYDPRKRAPLPSVKGALGLILPAIPMMILLFLLIPRIGPLWSVPLDTGAAKTGLSDSVSPGDISSLTRSDELAFRAGFDAKVPPQSMRYWRALVYSDFDGRTWQRAKAKGQTVETLIPTGEAIRYEVIMEPSNRPWLAALDMPISVQGADLRGARQAVTPGPIDKRNSYQMTSASSYQLDVNLDKRSRELNLDFPTELNPRTIALAKTWWIESQQQIDPFVAQIYRYFNQSFIYTLQPPVLGNNSVDQFMFDTQQGFCGHFASATALIFRAAGIPARLVGGYQGGEYNADAGYISVRQWDAHAWVEYHRPGLGWVRFDPTAAVAPERIEQNAQDLFANQPGFLADRPLSPLRFSTQGLLFEMRQAIDSLNFSWHRWVLNYQNQQSDLLRSLIGEITPFRMVLALLIPGAIIMGCVGFNLRPRRSKDPLEIAQQRFLNAATTLGFRRAPQQTITQLAIAIKTGYSPVTSNSQNQLVDLLEQLAVVDERWRYSGEASERQALVSLLIQTTRRLKMQKKLKTKDPSLDAYTNR